MADSHKPRHIRDIAHLYISRLKTHSSAPRATLLIAGDSKRCFPGFHAANLAAAFASRGIAVRLLELSGILPNAGFYMSLAPERYIHWDGRDVEVVFSGLSGIKIGYSLGARRGLEGSAGRPRIGLVHLPPASPIGEFQDSLERVLGTLGPPALAILLRLDGYPQWNWGSPGGLSRWPTCVLRLGKGIPREPEADRLLFDLGTLPEWEKALKDRVPAAVRAPGSALSRAYLSVCDSLLCKVNQARRTSGGIRSSSVTPGS